MVNRKKRMIFIAKSSKNLREDFSKRGLTLRARTAIIPEMTESIEAIRTATIFVYVRVFLKMS